MATTPLSAEEIVWLSTLGTTGLATMWLVSWWRAGRSFSADKILQSPGFFRSVIGSAGRHFRRSPRVNGVAVW